MLYEYSVRMGNIHSKSNSLNIIGLAGPSLGIVPIPGPGPINTIALRLSLSLGESPIVTEKPQGVENIIEHISDSFRRKLSEMSSMRFLYRTVLLLLWRIRLVTAIAAM